MMSMPIGIYNFMRRQPIMRLFTLSGLLVAVACIRVFSAEGTNAAAPSQLDIFTMGMGLVGGLALFLFGMEQLADALKARAGDSLKDVLARLTTNRVTGALTGAFVTACVQSSSVTTVLVVGFITANIMSLSQSVSVIFGANIGSTVTAQIIAFKVTKYALLLVAVGFAASFLGKREEIKQYGFMCMGMGMIFLGMGMMSSAMHPLRTYGPFLELMTQMESPLLAITVAAAFTGLIQSSAATTGIVIVMAGQGLISLPAGIALAFGANIGTCITAILASIGKPREAVRASMVHILFNIIGVLLWVGLIDQLGRIVV
jgi:phosphate:Na+ symporter